MSKLNDFLKFFKNLPKIILKHKVISGIIIVLIIIGGYSEYKHIKSSATEMRYVLAQVEKGTIVSSISGSGQVSALDQTDIKSKVSGDVVYLGIKNGQEVKKGDLLIRLDTTDAQKTVNDAKTSLETAELELDELLAPPDELDLLKAENAVTKAQQSKEDAEDSLEEAYEDSFNTVTSAFLDLPTIITGLRDGLYGYDIAKSETTISDYYWNISVLMNSVYYSDQPGLKKFTDSAESDYKTAREKYDKNLEDYKNTTRYADKSVIKALLEETIATTRAMADAAKSEINMYDYWVDYRSQHNVSTYSQVTTIQSNLKSYSSKVSSYLSSLLSMEDSIESDLKSITEAETSLKESQLSLDDLKAGADELEIRAKKITIQQKEDALTDAQQNLYDCYIRAPFDGVIASLDVKKGDSVSANGTVATIITQQKIAEIPLSEIDVTNVKIGQKATLTFDAISDLTITGEVSEIDTIGTASQGVVSYNATIVFDTQDERVKPGMSISAAIITDSRQDVLLVSNSAVKTQGEESYVEMMVDNAPQRQTVEVGLSDDTSTEITSGLKEGDTVVVSTVSSNSTTNSSKTTTQTQEFRVPGMGF